LLKWYEAEDGRIVAERLTKDPIRVDSERDDAEGELKPESRLNYSKIYTVENYVRVLNIGMVHRNSMESLLANSFVRAETEPARRPVKHPKRADSSKDNKSRHHKDKGGHRDKGKDSKHKT
jgi:hypothetical protein